MTIPPYTPVVYYFSMEQVAVSGVTLIGQGITGALAVAAQLQQAILLQVQVIGHVKMILGLFIYVTVS